MKSNTNRIKTPPKITGDLRKEFIRVAKLREFSDDQVDRLVEYCDCIVQANKLQLIISEDGEFYTNTRTGVIQAHPAFCRLEKINTRKDRLRKELLPPTRDLKTPKKAKTLRHDLI